MQNLEQEKLANYLKGLFHNDKMKLKNIPNKSEALELYKDEEFIGLVYKEEDEGETSYNLTISILNIDIDIE